MKIVRWLAFLFISLSISAYLAGKFLNYSINEDKDKATEFIRINTQYIVNMEIEKIRPLINPAYQDEFDSHGNKIIVEKYLQLGNVKTYDGPIYYGADISTGKYSEHEPIFYFLLISHFNAGNAEIKISLLKSGSTFLIDKISISGI